MILHHLVTIYLYIFSYMYNGIGGAVIALIHDISDIFITWTRAWGESEWKKVIGVSFLLTLAVWVYTRLVVFPSCVYIATFKLEIYTISPYIMPIFGFLLSCLFVLHIYWFGLMIRILISLVAKGETEDISQRSAPPKHHVSSKAKTQ